MRFEHVRTARLTPDLPVVAYLLEHDVRSRGRAERSGFSLVRRGPDAGDPDPDAVRLVFTDRPLDAALLERVTATTCVRGPGRERPPLVRSCPWGIASSRGRAVPMYHLIDDRDLEEGR